MKHNLFGSLFNKKELEKPKLNRATVEFTKPETKTIASMEIMLTSANQGWAEIKLLSNLYNPFKTKLNLYLTAFAEIMSQIADSDEESQLRNYISDIVSFMLDTQLQPEDRLNILGPDLELLPAPLKNQKDVQKLTTLLQITTPGNLVTTDFLFSGENNLTFLPTCLTLLLQEFIYTLSPEDLRNLLRATQAMEAYYQGVKKPGDPEARKEAPAYALRSIP